MNNKTEISDKNATLKKKSRVNGNDGQAAAAIRHFFTIETTKKVQQI